MANIRQSLEAMTKVEGVEAAALLELRSGLLLGTAGGGRDLEVEAAAGADLMKTQSKVLQTLGRKDSVEDVLVTTGRGYALLHQVNQGPALGQGLLLFVRLRRTVAGATGARGVNLALAQIQLKQIEQEMVV